METKARILVVDDEKDLLEGVRLTLERAGYQVFAVGSGSQALQLLAVEPVDLILSDIAMPMMNGYQLYEKVIANPDRIEATSLGGQRNLANFLPRDWPLDLGELYANLHRRHRRRQRGSRTALQRVQPCSNRTTFPR